MKRKFSLPEKRTFIHKSYIFLSQPNRQMKLFHIIHIQCFILCRRTRFHYMMKMDAALSASSHLVSAKSSLHAVWACIHGVPDEVRRRIRYLFVLIQTEFLRNLQRNCNTYYSAHVYTPTTYSSAVFGTPIILILSREFKTIRRSFDFDFKSLSKWLLI